MTRGLAGLSGDHRGATEQDAFGYCGDVHLTAQIGGLRSLGAERRDGGGLPADALRVAPGSEGLTASIVAVDGQDARIVLALRHGQGAVGIEAGEGHQAAGAGKDAAALGRGLGEGLLRVVRVLHGQGPVTRHERTAEAEEVIVEIVALTERAGLRHAHLGLGVDLERAGVVEGDILVVADAHHGVRAHVHQMPGARRQVGQPLGIGQGQPALPANSVAWM